MAFRSDFQVVTVEVHLGDKEADLDAPRFRFVGNEVNVPFTIDGQPQAGYLLLNTYDVDSYDHRVKINGKDLPYFDLTNKAADKRWQTRMDDIPSGFLQNGRNTLTIQRAEGGDNFLVDRVVVHWRESD